jgi:hypothetical protein
MSDPVVLTSVDSFIVRGRRVFNIAAVSGLDPRTLQDQVLVLDGQTVRVRGVETYAVVDATGQPFGLLVELVPGGQVSGKE